MEARTWLLVLACVGLVGTPTGWADDATDPAAPDADGGDPATTSPGEEEVPNVIAHAVMVRVLDGEAMPFPPGAAPVCVATRIFEAPPSQGGEAAAPSVEVIADDSETGPADDGAEDCHAWVFQRSAGTLPHHGDSVFVTKTWVVRDGEDGPIPGHGEVEVCRIAVPHASAADGEADAADVPVEECETHPSPMSARSGMLRARPVQPISDGEAGEGGCSDGPDVRFHRIHADAADGEAPVLRVVSHEERPDGFDTTYVGGEEGDEDAPVFHITCRFVGDADGPRSEWAEAHAEPASPQA